MVNESSFHLPLTQSLLMSDPWDDHGAQPRAHSFGGIFVGSTTLYMLQLPTVSVIKKNTPLNRREDHISLGSHISHSLVFCTRVIVSTCGRVHRGVRKELVSKYAVQKGLLC